MGAVSAAVDTQISFFSIVRIAIERQKTNLFLTHSDYTANTTKNLFIKGAESPLKQYTMSSKESKKKEGSPTVSLRPPEDLQEDEPSRRVAVAVAAPPRLLQSHQTIEKPTPGVICPVPPVPKEVVPKFAWRLDRVPTLPECHVLESTAVFVPNAVPQVISERISDILRVRSIEAVYDDDKAKVKCVSADGVDFRVRLYRGRGKFNHGIIVEVQRRFGTSLNFHQDTMAILNKAEGKSVPPPPPSFGRDTTSSSSLPLIVSDSEEDEQASTDGSSSLSMVEKMFEHPAHDTHSLGYQLLTSLTDSSKVGVKTARSVSSKLLEADNAVGSKVLSLVLDRKGEDELFKLRTCAFTVLANAMHAVKGDMSDTPLREQLSRVLIDELRDAQENPRLAVQAARCVEMLLHKNEQEDADMHSALMKANEVGAARHAGLEEQAQKCLAKFT